MGCQHKVQSLAGKWQPPNDWQWHCTIIPALHMSVCAHSCACFPIIKVIFLPFPQRIFLMFFLQSSQSKDCHSSLWCLHYCHLKMRLCHIKQTFTAAVLTLIFSQDSVFYLYVSAWLYIFRSYSPNHVHVFSVDASEFCCRLGAITVCPCLFAYRWSSSSQIFSCVTPPPLLFLIFYLSFSSLSCTLASPLCHVLSHCTPSPSPRRPSSFPSAPRDWWMRGLLLIAMGDGWWLGDEWWGAGKGANKGAARGWGLPYWC